MSRVGWKQKWRGPVPGGGSTRAGALGVRWPVAGSNLNWKMALGPPRLSMWGTNNWLRVLDPAEDAQIDHRVPQQLHPIVPLLDAFKAEQQPLEFVLPCEGALDPQA